MACCVLWGFHTVCRSPNPSTIVPGAPAALVWLILSKLGAFAFILHHYKHVLHVCHMKVAFCCLQTHSLSAFIALTLHNYSERSLPLTSKVNHHHCHPLHVSLNSWPQLKSMHILPYFLKKWRFKFELLIYSCKSPNIFCECEISDPLASIGK